MPSFVSTLVLAFLVIAVAGMILYWYRRPPALRRRVNFKISRVFRSDSPVRDREHDRNWLNDTLTEREMQVARLVALGRHNKEIARELNIAPHTVESHIRSIYDKLGIHSRVDLAREIHDLID